MEELAGRPRGLTDSEAGPLLDACRSLCSEQGVDFDTLWWIDRPDRACVTVGVSADAVAEAIGRVFEVQRYDGRNVTVVQSEGHHLALRDGSILVQDSDGSTIELCDGWPVTSGPAEVCTYAEMRGLVQSQFGSAFTYHAVDGLYDAAPEHSAKYVLSRNQFVASALLGLVSILSLWFAPIPYWMVVLLIINVFLFCAVSFKLVAVLAGVVSPGERPETSRLDSYPFYTILAPVFREPEVVQGLARNLAAMEYPADRFETLLLIEEVDDVTMAALDEIPGNLLPVVVPASQPQTKPKACNWALHVARGEFVVIFDAEDKPDTDQLLIALAEFKRPGNEDVLVTQAALDYWNDEQNFITRLFALEYGFWFQFMLPGLSRLGVPIPLGGTSNHFRSAPLRELHGWDGYNVTEDADLGIRAAAEGWRVTIIPSTTSEEANSNAWNFVRQRSRWIKGYMMTTLVRLRHPVQLYRTVGVKGFLSFLFLIAGTPFTFLTTPLLWILFIVTQTIRPEALDPLFTGWLGTLPLINLLVVNAVVVWLNLLACSTRGRHKLVWWTFVNPAYWLLHSTASYLALYELIVKPHFWQKTNHGLADGAHGADHA